MVINDTKIIHIQENLKRRSSKGYLTEPGRRYAE